MRRAGAYLHGSGGDTHEQVRAPGEDGSAPGGKERVGAAADVPEADGGGAEAALPDDSGLSERGAGAAVQQPRAVRVRDEPGPGPGACAQHPQPGGDEGLERGPQTMEFVRRNADIGFKVLSGKDTLIYSGLGVGAVGAVCSTANYLPSLVCSIYERYVAGDIKGSLEAQLRLNPIRLATDKSSFPVATKDLANLVGSKVGRPYLPTMPSPAAQMENLRQSLIDGGFDVVE